MKIKTVKTKESPDMIEIYKDIVEQTLSNYRFERYNYIEYPIAEVFYYDIVDNKEGEAKVYINLDGNLYLIMKATYKDKNKTEVAWRKIVINLCSRGIHNICSDIYERIKENENKVSKN